MSEQSSKLSVTERAAAMLRQIRAERAGTLTITIDSGCCEGTAPHLYENETWLVIGTEAGFAQLRSLDEPSRSTVLMGHRGPLEDARFSPDSRWLGTVGADGARWWDLTAPHPEAASVLVPGGRPVAIMPVAFQRGLVTIDDQGALHFWPNVATSEPGRFPTSRVTPERRPRDGPEFDAYRMGLAATGPAV